MTFECIVVAMGGLVVVGIIVLFVYLNRYSEQKAREERERKKKALEEAWKAYYLSLEALKKAPSDPGLRQEALALGRTYSSHTREGHGVTLYDEVALMNDINAAAAAGSQSQPQPQATLATGSTSTVEERLAKLRSLREAGQISDD